MSRSTSRKPRKPPPPSQPSSGPLASGHLRWASAAAAALAVGVAVVALQSSHARPARAGATTILSAASGGASRAGFGAGVGERDPNLEYYELPPGDVVRGSVINPFDGVVGSEDKRSEFEVARGLVSRAGAAAVVHAMRASRQFERGPDSTDDQPTFERHVLKYGKVQEKDVHAAFLPLWDDFVGHVRTSLNCSTCELCNVLARRYLPGERRAVPEHRDINAFATAVLTLNADEFSGGYYVCSYDGGRRGGQGSQTIGRHLHLPLRTGDVLVHSADVMHGVNVTRGERYSLVGWFKDRPGLCESDDNPWVLEAAERGNADAAYLVATDHNQKYAPHVKWRMALFAAHSGHGVMMEVVNKLIAKNDPKDDLEAIKILRKAVKWGRRDMILYYAWALDNGRGVAKDPKKALHYRRRAARLGQPQAVQELEAAGLSIDE